MNYKVKSNDEILSIICENVFYVINLCKHIKFKYLIVWVCHTQKSVKQLITHKFLKINILSKIFFLLNSKLKIIKSH